MAAVRNNNINYSVYLFIIAMTLNNHIIYETFTKQINIKRQDQMRI